MASGELVDIGCVVLERGWLSSNNIVFPFGTLTAIVDTGYCTHSSQTLTLLKAALSGRSLDLILNTHLHSDHCGGNSALLERYPASRMMIPLGQADSVRAWDVNALSYVPTGQSCPRFIYHDVLQPGENIQLGEFFWEIHAAPGHDPHSVVLFEPASKTLISADALWGNGFGVVFPELDGICAFDEVAVTLDLIEKLSPKTVIPGHGSVFSDVPDAIGRARTRLDMFVQNPVRHAQYAAKVLLKYKLLELQQCSRVDLLQWVTKTPYFRVLQSKFFKDQSLDRWVTALLEELQRSKALELQGNWVINRD
jgi:glyoxylase-like metal-dependent hydrolase (beta-lactamase superfamily II)